MKILFDQATPLPIRQYLRSHIVRTAAQEGWSRLRNGDLLRAAEQAGFDLLLTSYRNMGYQQNLTGRKLAIVVISLQQWPQLRLHIQSVVDAVNVALPGSYMEVECGSSHDG
jgi:hypothetical protein